MFLEVNCDYELLWSKWVVDSFSQTVLKQGKDITVLEKVAEGNKANPGLKKMSFEDTVKKPLTSKA